MDVINHIEIAVNDAEASRRFYEAALKPLDISLVISVDPKHTVSGGARYGFGRDGYPSFWIHEEAGAKIPTHVAFTARARNVVDDFHARALRYGGRENGRPGVRERYHPTYYAAYVLDPDENNIEAVCQTE
ncbi:VOC family protein [Sphingobium yanoikuyae]|uniref:Glyoxalase/bleomycin resistance/extradiol dioxygenase family protein n=1 Tax=Sphingobium yanoikuyae TaxID=13690 RepID=A0A291MXU3_SPHYA|nr:VOC family protein [Sphingobium yanoikuyae]ATI79933.1 glyoxalase/bleomycin resistance/extradiol dioxygenase family protein [Sphingobium yanoikuyae]